MLRLFKTWNALAILLDFFSLKLKEEKEIMFELKYSDEANEQYFSL